MEHSKMFERIKKYYPKWWKKAAVAEAVVRGWITAEEYEEIVGEPYGD